MPSKEKKRAKSKSPQKKEEKKKVEANKTDATNEDETPRILKSDRKSSKTKEKQKELKVEKKPTSKTKKIQSEAKVSFNAKNKELETKQVDDFDEYDLENPLSDNTEEMSYPKQTRKSKKSQQKVNVRDSTGAAEEVVRAAKQQSTPDV